MARAQAARWLVVLSVGSMACSQHAAMDRVSGTDPAVLAANAIASADPALRRVLAANDDGLRLDEEGLTSPGWRAASAGRFDELGALLPGTADGIVEVGVSRIERLRLRITFVGAAAVAARIDDGRVVYPDAWPSTDAVVATTSTRFETLLLLRDAVAPRDFAWRVELPRGIAGTRPDGTGGLFLDDTAGEAALHVPRPFAVDAKGARREADLAWRAGELTVHLDTSRLVFPLLLDPAVETAFWEEKMPAASPPARYAHAMAYDSARAVTVLFGGTTAGGGSPLPLGDTWEWDGTSWSPACITSPCDAVGSSPPPRGDPSMAFDASHGKTLLFGGWTMMNTVVNDTWQWDGTLWTSVCPTGCTPPGIRSFAAMSYDQTRSRVVLFGGLSYDGCGNDVPYTDTWEWVGTTWSQATPASSPPGRWAHAMVYDRKNKLSVLFGGGQNGPPLGDTWTWDGSAWTNVCTTAPCSATVPPARYNHVMAYDSIRQKTVLFGGGVTGSPLADTWEWDGTAWSPTAQGAAPPARLIAGMAFDEKRATAVLFGGYDAMMNPFGDTWVYHAHGGACSADSQCDTGHCVDGVCCESVCGVCSRCDQVASLVPGTPPPDPIPTPGVCSAVTNGPDKDSCTGDNTCDVTGACKGGPGHACKVGGDCASGSCQGGCCDGAACVKADGGAPHEGGVSDAGGSDGAEGGSKGESRSGRGCGCRLVAPTHDRSAAPATLALFSMVGAVFRQRARRRGAKRAIAP